MIGFNSTRWQVPQPDLTPTALPYPQAALPRLIREAVECAVIRDHASYALYSTIANAAVTLAVQGLAILRQNGRDVPLSESYLVVSAPATGKSSGFRTFFTTVKVRDEVASAAYRKLKEEYPTRLRDWTQQRADVIQMISRKRLRGEPYEYLQAELDLLVKAMPTKPREKNWLITDTTGASLVNRIGGSNESIGIACGEGEVIFRHIYEYLSHLNMAWDGDDITISRKGEGTVFACKPRIMTLILTQPDVFNRFRSSRNDLASGMGAWARFLPVFPSNPKNELFSDLDTARLAEALHAFLIRVAELVAERERRVKAGVIVPDVIELDGDADACLSSFRCEMKSRGTDGDLVDVNAFAARAPEHAARLAASYSYFCGERKVTLDVMERAISVIRYHLEAYISCFSLKNTVPDVQLHAEELDGYLQRRYWGMGFSSVPMTQIERNGPTALRNVAVLVPALKWLEARGKIRLLSRGRTYYIQYVPK